MSRDRYWDWDLWIFDNFWELIWQLLPFFGQFSRNWDISLLIKAAGQWTPYHQHDPASKELCWALADVSWQVTIGIHEVLVGGNGGERLRGGTGGYRGLEGGLGSTRGRGNPRLTIVTGHPEGAEEPVWVVEYAIAHEAYPKIMHCCQLWGWQHRKIEWVVLIEYTFISATVVCSWIKLINEWREVAAASLVILGLWPSSVLSCSLGFKVNKHEDNP